MTNGIAACQFVGFTGFRLVLNSWFESWSVSSDIIRARDIHDNDTPRHQLNINIFILLQVYQVYCVVN
jgi:hypothetical protein